MSYYQEPVNKIFKTNTNSFVEEITLTQEEWDLLRAEWLLSSIGNQDDKSICTTRNH